MLRQIIIISLLVVNIFALDATMEIVKKKSSLPTISVSIANKETSKLDQKISKLIQKDLLVSGHFNNSDIKFDFDFDKKIDFIKVQNNGIDLYMLLDIKQNKQKSLIINMKLYDINSRILVMNKSYSTSSKARYPFLCHKIAIDTNKYLKAPSIDWMDKFVIFARYLTSRKSEIVISDYTLTYQKVVVKGGLNIFPKWAGKDQENFYYTTYNYGKPTLVKQNLFTREKTKILSSDGMIVCSDVSDDGYKLVLTMAPNSQPDIYVYDLRTKLKKRITYYRGIDVGGSFVEDDTKVVFVSDRLRYPNIFAKSLDSKGVERLIYHGRNNSQCTTYKDYIAYSSRETDNEFGKNIFNLYLISTKSDYVRRLTTSGVNQFPKFSKDGESILFIKNFRGKSYLGIIRVNYNKSFLFYLKSGKLQSIDW